jgi:hypothetical protein
MDSDQSTCKDKLNWYHRHFKPLREIIVKEEYSDTYKSGYWYGEVVWWLVTCQDRAASPDVKDNLGMMSNLMMGQ